MRRLWRGRPLAAAALRAGGASRRAGRPRVRDIDDRPSPGSRPERPGHAAHLDPPVLSSYTRPQRLRTEIPRLETLSTPSSPGDAPRSCLALEEEPVERAAPQRRARRAGRSGTPRPLRHARSWSALTKRRLPSSPRPRVGRRRRRWDSARGDPESEFMIPRALPPPDRAARRGFSGVLAPHEPVEADTATAPRAEHRDRTPLAIGRRFGRVAGCSGTRRNARGPAEERAKE